MVSLVSIVRFYCTSTSPMCTYDVSMLRCTRYIKVYVLFKHHMHTSIHTYISCTYMLTRTYLQYCISCIHRCTYVWYLLLHIHVYTYLYPCTVWWTILCILYYVCMYMYIRTYVHMCAPMCMYIWCLSLHTSLIQRV